MSKILCLLFIVSSLSAHAQSLDFSQSSNSLKWETISNDFVKVIYPTTMKSESVYIANLIEHYASVIGESYEIKKPLLFTLIIRPEVAAPNGFVSLAPRRSEWFSSSTFSPFVGSSEWYQSLSIHEYRHVIQYDYLDSGLINVADYLFGDFGKSVAMYMGVPSWYFEGDALWAETKYTDAGRGRSPLFLARLKALILSDDIPTYDEFVNGTYNTLLPNHYVYGYVLVSSATKRFGEDFWKKVMGKIASIPHPYRIYSAFKDVSGISFYDFYNETLQDLRRKWVSDKENKISKIDYRENIYPFKVGRDIYYLHRTLDSYWEVTKRSGTKVKKILDIPFSDSIGQFHVSESAKAVYAQLHPDSRYAYKGTSEIYLIDLKTGDNEKLVAGKRLYNPRFNFEGDKFIAVEFTQEQKWKLNEYDLGGKLLRSISIKDHKISQAVYLSTDKVVAIINDKSGFKSIAKIDLANSKVVGLLKPSRNNLYALSSDRRGSVLFEAQYKGQVNIFQIDSEGKFYQCSDSKIGAFTPSSDGRNLYYSNMDTNGSHIAMSPLSKCVTIPANNLVDFNYLGNSPTDNYNNFPLTLFPEQSKLYKQNGEKYLASSYGHIDSRLFVPHSWSFIGGRGLQVGVSTRNYLNTLALNAAYGIDSEEKEPFGSFNFDINLFYPLFSLSADMRERHVDIYNYSNDLEWEEKVAGIKMTIPYFAKSGLYNFKTSISLGASYMDASEYVETFINQARENRFFYTYSGGLSFQVAKDLKPRSIIAPWALSLVGQYDDAHNTKNENYSSYRFYVSARAQIPGLFNHNGFFVTYEQEKQRDSQSAYQFIPFATDSLGYVFSRGYQYQSVPEYRKLTGNYIFPLAYPDLNIWGIYYLRRLYSTLYFDSTRIESKFKSDTLNSYGAQLEFESKFFRILPINLGTRYIRKMKDDTNVAEFYLATELGF